MTPPASKKNKKRTVWRPVAREEKSPEHNTDGCHFPASLDKSPLCRASPGSGSGSASGKMAWADIMDQEEDHEEDTNESTCLPIASPRTRSRSPSLVTASEFSDAGCDLPVDSCAPEWSSAPFDGMAGEDTSLVHVWPWEQSWDQAYAPEHHDAELGVFVGSGYEGIGTQAFLQAPSPSLRTWVEVDTEARSSRSWQRSVETAKNAASQHRKFLALKRGNSQESWLSEGPKEATVIPDEASYCATIDTGGQGWAADFTAELHGFPCGAGDIEFIPGRVHNWPCDGAFSTFAEGFPEEGCLSFVDMNVPETWERQPYCDLVDQSFCESVEPVEQFGQWHEACGQLEHMPDANFPLARDQSSDFEAVFSASPEDSPHVRAGRADGRPVEQKRILGQSPASGPVTTLMIHSIPHNCSREMLCDELDKLGLEGQYDFVHLPIDRSSRQNVAYAFVNFVSASVVARARRRIEGHRFCKCSSPGKASWVTTAHLQGLANNVEHYRNTTSRPLIIEAKRS